MSDIPRGTSGRKHPNEDAVRDGATRGSAECQRVIDSWEQGSRYKAPSDVDEHHHPYFAAIQDGASAGSELCKHRMSDWGFPMSSSRQRPHEAAIREAARLGSSEANKVVDHWDKGSSYKAPGEEHGRRFFFAVSEGAEMGSQLCKDVMMKSWNMRL